MEMAGGSSEAEALSVAHPLVVACLASPEQTEEQLLVAGNASAPSTPSLADRRAGFATTALSFIFTSHAEVLPLPPAWSSSRAFQVDSIDQRIVGMAWVSVVCNGEPVCVMRADAPPQKHSCDICHLINVPLGSLHVQYF